ncbi:MAG: hypothetical protein IIB41_02900, partial [Candidatus Marinimicrobia bacterium]|nr:hypothetical protein [Candidatus Neomarinimicrobiota bacterium]
RGNTATSNGGGIYCSDSRPSLVDVKIIENEAKGSGGGIYFSNFIGGGGPRLENVTISRNIAPNGGGIACYWSNPILKNVVIVGNIATRGGGI